MNRTIDHLLHGELTNSERTWLIGLGSGLCLFGLTRSFPLACLCGIIGCAVATEGCANVALQNRRSRPRGEMPDFSLRDMPRQMAHAAD